MARDAVYSVDLWYQIPRKKTACFLLSRKASTNWTGKYKHHWELDPLFQGLSSSNHSSFISSCLPIAIISLVASHSCTVHKYIVNNWLLTSVQYSFCDVRQTFFQLVQHEVFKCRAVLCYFTSVWHFDKFFVMLRPSVCKKSEFTVVLLLCNLELFVFEFIYLLNIKSINLLTWHHRSGLVLSTM